MSSFPTKPDDTTSDKLYAESLPLGDIRVLELEPGLDGEPITCTLRPVSLEAAVDTYEAISYVWGDPRQVSSILCNEIKQDITRSLALALRAVRHATERRIFWADAICINQNDIEEKGQQVKQMGKVYESAKRVLIHLGPDEESIAEDCFHLIKDFNHFWDQRLREHRELRKVPNRPAYSYDGHQKSFKSIATLFSLPWFDRLWVVQEAGLAKECVVLWGQASISFAELVELILWLDCRADIAQQVQSGVPLKWSNIFFTHQCTLGNKATWRTDLPLCAWVNDEIATVPEHKHFIEALGRGRDMKASDPRDHVFGFLGSPLAQIADGRSIVDPDYTRAVEDVFFDTSCALLHHPQEASFLLGAVDHASSVHVVAEDGWPSWVPRWHLGHWTTPLAVAYNWYHAGGASELFTAAIQPNRGLKLEGIIFDKLSWVSSTILEHNLGTDSERWNEECRVAGKSPVDCLWESVVDSCCSGRDELLEEKFMVTLCREYPSSKDVKTKGVHLSFLRDDFTAYRKLMRKIAARASTRAPAQNSGSGRALRFANKLSACDNRWLAHTEAERMVLTPRFAQPNDVCCIFPGVSVPFILRESQEAGTYHLVGDCYIYGVMRGEVLKHTEEGRHKLEIIRIK